MAHIIMLVRRQARIVPCLLALGCGSTGPDGALVSVQLDVRDGYTTPATVRVAIEDASVDLVTPGPHPNGGVVTSRFGSYPVRVALIGAARDTLATAMVAGTFQRDYTHGVLVLIARARPIGFCLGTASVAAVKGSPGDTLYAYFNSLPNGAVC